ncbi:putative ABC transporter permease YvcS [Shouchella clausii]|nr:putative ABC transporter permease YvcS [Shouchella clausii]
MNLRTLARRNITGNAQRYAAYFLSCVFTVMIFFIYAQFIFHPDIAEESIHQVVKNGMVAAQVIIVLFSIFFIAYSNNVFLQVRSQEFGLLTLFGMNRHQLRSLVYYEQTIISIVAIICGLLLGTLFSKLFLMFMTMLLAVDAPITFKFVPAAYLVTGVGFFLLFQVLSLLSFWKLRNQEVIQMLKEASKPKMMPKTSVWLTVLTVICLGAGYGLAVTTNMMTVMLTMFPVLGLVVVGTYFLFTQGTVALYKRLYSNKRSLYSGTTLITRTNTLFRLKDYARMLFLTSVISAVVLTASGTVYMFFNAILTEGMGNMPYSIFWTVEEVDDEADIITTEKVESLLAEYDSEVLFKIDEQTLVAMFQGTPSYMNEPSVLFGSAISESTYNRISTDIGLEPVSLEGNEVIAYSREADLFAADQFNELTITFGETEQTFTDLEVRNEVLFSSNSTFILSDEAFAKAEQAPAVQHDRFIAYELDDWQNETEVSEAIMDATGEHGYLVQAKPYQYHMLMQMYSLILFIGLFVSLLFFIVQGSMLYLKLFTDLADTKKQLFALSRIGLTDKEKRRILDKQMAFLFFVPVLVGSIHASFAYVMLSNMLDVNLVLNAILVISIYAVLQLIYFLITRLLYFRAALN